MYGQDEKHDEDSYLDAATDVKFTAACVISFLPEGCSLRTGRIAVHGAAYEHCNIAMEGGDEIAPT